jgi:hypothetical protein
MKEAEEERLIGHSFFDIDVDTSKNCIHIILVTYISIINMPLCHRGLSFDAISYRDHTYN